MKRRAMKCNAERLRKEVFGNHFGECRKQETLRMEARRYHASLITIRLKGVRL
jgi:hypothetical protein